MKYRPLISLLSTTIFPFTAFAYVDPGVAHASRNYLLVVLLLVGGFLFGPLLARWLRKKLAGGAPRNQSDRLNSEE